MKTRCIHIDLGLCQNIHVGFASKFGGGNIAYRLIDVVATLWVKNANAPVYSAILE